MYVVVSWFAQDNPAVQSLVLQALAATQAGSKKSKKKLVFTHEWAILESCVLANFPENAGGLPGLLADALDALRAQPGAPAFEYLVTYSQRGNTAFTSLPGPAKTKLLNTVNR